ncbi:MAG TPA: SIMPL domain-containing protein [Thermomicrobiales bacterium]|nr:SIMPL domain-containing protein [Thermomicrobiales bacterium]
MKLTNRMLPVLGALIAVAIVVAVVVSASGGDRQRAAAAETDATRTINVSGTGSVSLTPDIVTMQLGVDIRNEDLGAAQQEAAETMDSLISALRAAGIAERDIQTSGYSIWLEYDYNKTPQTVVGYHVAHTVTVTVRDIDRAGATIETAVENGATVVHGVWFGLSDPSEAVKQARELAVADAQEKAEDLARLTQSTLGPVQSISEGYSSPGQPIPYPAAERAFDTAASAPPINPGETEVMLTVSVSYAIN